MLRLHYIISALFSLCSLTLLGSLCSSALGNKDVPPRAVDELGMMTLRSIEWGTPWESWEPLAEQVHDVDKKKREHSHHGQVRTEAYSLPVIA